MKGFVVSLQIGNLNTRYIYIQMHIDARKHTHTHNNMMPSLTNADYGAYIHRPRPLDVSPSPSFDRTSSGHNPGLGSPPKARGLSVNVAPPNQRIFKVVFKLGEDIRLKASGQIEHSLAGMMASLFIAASVRIKPATRYSRDLL